MSLNKSAIEWTEYTWNPIVGCKHNCWYCYAREMARRNLWKCEKCRTFEPHFHKERLTAPMKRKKPATIFVGSMCDMWGDWVPPTWIEDTLCATMWADDDPENDADSPHRFLTLTKNPKRYLEFAGMINAAKWWCGTTVTGKAPSNSIVILKEGKQFVSIEPFLDLSFDPIFMTAFDWIIIGPLNKRGYDPVTKREWVERIMEVAKAANVPVFLKRECRKIGFTEAEIKANQEFPW